MEVEWDKDRIEGKGFFLSVYHLSLIVLQHLLSIAIPIFHQTYCIK